MRGVADFPQIAPRVFHPIFPQSVESVPTSGGVPLRVISEYLDGYLRVAEVPDYPTALNGLQVENGGTVSRVAVAVDAVQATIDAAVAARADLLVVHHGLFWDGNQPVTGRRYRRLKRLLDAGIAVYSAHLPLDVHPSVGNNVMLAKALGIEIDGTVGSYRGHPIGVSGRLELRREALAARLDELLGCRVKLVAGGPERTTRVGVVTGGAAGELAAARQLGIDTFVTGEGAHHNFFDAEEGGINLLLGGHYATETWGVKALGGHLEEHFGLPWTFIDHPTGL
jgi:dinuclear metal center YbgI/SA1388 family protein